MAASITLYSAFDPADVAFGQVEKNRKGGKLVSVYHSGTSRQITLQSPACRLPWGVSAYTDNGTAEVSDR